MTKQNRGSSEAIPTRSPLTNSREKRCQDGGQDAKSPHPGHLLLGLVVLVLLQQAGTWIARAVGLPVPGAVLGMVLLLGLLLIGPPRWLRRAIDGASLPLLGHMMLFFIPAVAGIVEQAPALASGWLPFVAACIIGAALTMAATGLTLKWLLARQAASRGAR